MTKTLDADGRAVIPATSLETRLLVDFLRKRKAGDTVTFDDLEAVIGRSCRAATVEGARGYGYFCSARRIVESEDGIVLSSEKGIGYRVCRDGEKLQVAAAHQKRARRALRRSTRTLSATDRDKLTEPERRDYDARSSILGALRLMADAKAVETVRKEIGEGALPSGTVLRLFAGTKAPGRGEIRKEAAE